MSATGATIERRGVHVPIWPILALLVIAVATGITLRVMDDARPAAPAAAVDDTYVSWQSTVQDATRAAAADRYVSWQSTVQDAVNSLPSVRPTMVSVIGVSAYEASAAAVRELPATAFHSDGRAHEVVFGSDAPAPPFEIPDYRLCRGCGGRR